MKKMKLYMILAVLIGFGISSCGDDDDDDQMMQATTCTTAAAALVAATNTFTTMGNQQTCEAWVEAVNATAAACETQAILGATGWTEEEYDSILNSVNTTLDCENL